MESFRTLQQRTIRQLLTSRQALLRPSFRQLTQHAPRPRNLHTRPSPFLNQTSRPRPKNLNTKTCQSHFARPGRRHQSSSTTADASANLSLSARLRKLSREYGWSALGVYLTLSALDFPFCFLAVRTLGTDRIGHWEHVVLSWIKSVVPESVLEIKWPWGQEEVEKMVEGEGRVDGRVDEVEYKVEGGKRLLEEKGGFYKHEVAEGSELMDHGYNDAEKANRGENASLWTQLALAYAIHKSFIFIRVPLTAAVTPKVVKTLRGWGWNIGKRPAKKTKTLVDGVGVNTKGTGVKPDK